MTDQKVFAVTWANRRDFNANGAMSIFQRAHLIRVPINEQRMTCCGLGVSGGEWVAQTESATRCGRCEEAARNHLGSHVQ